MKKYINIILIFSGSVSLVMLFVLGGNNETWEKTASMVLYFCITLFFIINFKDILRIRPGE